MNANKRANPSAAKKTKKRKMEDVRMSPAKDSASPSTDVADLVESLRSGVLRPADALDLTALRKAAHALADRSKHDEHIDDVVSHGGVEAVVPLLSLHRGRPDQGQQAPLFEELQKEACFILGLLAIKPEYQSRITEAGALTDLVTLLKEHREAATSRGHAGSGGVARRAADAITNLAHENMEIKNMVRRQDGIKPLVALLQAWDIKVQRAAAGALRTLAFKNEENKNQIVEAEALPVLIQMLRSEDVGVHYEAVGVIGNLVHSSQNIKRRVLEEGALQPVINLLSSVCPESRREAALLLGQFATTDQFTKQRIVQRGAVPPLIQMLQVEDVSLREMAAFALGRLATNEDNQAGIVQAGGLPALLGLLESSHHNLQHNAAFAVYGLADNEDNVPEIIREGGLQRLIDAGEKLIQQASKDCVQKTIGRMEGKIASGMRALRQLHYMLRSTDRAIRQRVCTAMARLAPVNTLYEIFVVKHGLDVLLDMLSQPATSSGEADASGGAAKDAGCCPDAAKAQKDAATALVELARKVNALPADPSSAGPSAPALPGAAAALPSTAAAAPSAAPPPPSAVAGPKTVYLGAEFVNNKDTLSDITFVVEGREFYAHRIALLASSDAFRAMFSGGYREKDAPRIEIPNIPWAVFEAMMRYCYTGSVDVPPPLASQLLQAADQYLLDGLKRLCEETLAGELTAESVASTFELAEAFTARGLAKRCVLFVLERHAEVVSSMKGDGAQLAAYGDLLARMAPTLRCSLLEDLERVHSTVAADGGNNSPTPHSPRQVSAS